MGHTIELTSSDNHRPSASVAEPAGKPRGGLVVIQEFFGVTRHIRAVADQYAAAGYLAAARLKIDAADACGGAQRGVFAEKHGLKSSQT
jgi:carboxymethylenebutenolidase